MNPGAQWEINPDPINALDSIWRENKVDREREEYRGGQSRKDFQ